MTHELDTHFGLDAMVERMGTAIVEGVTQALAGSELVSRLNQSLDGIVQRIDSLETQSTDTALLERIAELEREVAGLRAKETAGAQAAKPEAPKAPPVLPANMPRSPSIANLPFGLSAEPPRRSPPRRRNRTAVRPTVIYRTDPRTASAAKPEAKPKPKTEPQPEPAPVKDAALETSPDQPAVAEAGEAICAEPGCDRPVRCRDLCSLHYQRVRYKERKIEAKQESADPVLLPPPPRRQPSASGGRRAKTGGTKGVFALLYEDNGRKTLAASINQMKFDRSDLVERLNQQFAGLPGVPLESEDVLRAVHYHKLGEALRQREGRSSAGT